MTCDGRYGQSAHDRFSGQSTLSRVYVIGANRMLQRFIDRLRLVGNAFAARMVCGQAGAGLHAERRRL
ncbi:MAG: hypothetical protein HXY40_12335 [Chloroflexi bacterium]|nr:hypothetical protein [Chloroflexota bacterium]